MIIWEGFLVQEILNAKAVAIQNSVKILKLRNWLFRESIEMEIYVVYIKQCRLKKYDDLSNITDLEES